MTNARANLVSGVAAVALAAAGTFTAAAGAWQLAATGRALEDALTGSLTRARELDVIRHQVRAEQGTPTSAAQLLDGAIGRATSAEERAGLERAKAALAAGETAAFAQALAGVDEVHHAHLAPAWRAAEDARKQLRLLLGAAALLVAAALALALRRRPPAAAPVGDNGLVDVLRVRLDELYGARARLGEDQRFAALGEIAAGLSHGLKTPLASVRAAAQAAQARLGHDSPVNAQLDDIIREADGLTEQVQRFLRLFKDMSVSFSQFAPGRLAELMAARYEADAAARGLAVKLAVDPATPEVKADPALLELALRNVVENALFASQRGKAVTVGVRPAQPPARAGLDQQPPAPGAWVELYVEDEGEGVSSRAAHAPGETTRSTGSGLGLALTRRLVGRHGGAVHFETRDGGGTCVRLFLPCSPPEA